MLVLKRLELHDWRQFGRIDIGFDQQFTILTGANASGKTTLLRLLSRMVEWRPTFGMTVTTEGWTPGVERYYPDQRWKTDECVNEAVQGSPAVYSRSIGSIELATLDQKNITKLLKISYNDTINNSKISIDPAANTVDGCYLPSHRPPVVRRTLDSIPASFAGFEEIFRQYRDDYQNWLANNPRQPINHSLKGAIAQMARLGFSTSEAEGNPILARAYKAFTELVRKLLPDEVGFERFKLVQSDVLLQCSTGEFSIDEVSGGLAALLDLAWQLFLCSYDKDASLVLIDEPENHLHPRMQRMLLPRLQAAFPQTQFVIATHNPLVIGSLPDAAVYALKFNAEGTVGSHALGPIESPATADPILQDVLGLEVLEPDWVMQRMQEIVQRYTALDVTADSLRQLRQEMEGAGLRDAFPEAVEQLDQLGR